MNRRGARMRAKSTWCWLCVVLVATCAMVSTVFAHHGWSSYDASKTLNFTGPASSLSCLPGCCCFEQRDGFVGESCFQVEAAAPCRCGCECVRVSPLAIQNGNGVESRGSRAKSSENLGRRFAGPLG
jgi:hypothetical protein